MFVQTLKGQHFRNYSQFSAVFSPGKNIILGKNGQGKTNLLEALYFLSHARSHRAHSDRELVQFGQSFSTVSAALKFHQHEAESVLGVEVKLDSSRLKTCFKHHVNVLKSKSEVLGLLPTVSFFLPDLLLLRGTPDNRRSWLDAAIAQYDKRHLSYCVAFNKVKQQKSRLLKADLGQISREHLSVWNIQFAASGARVILSRLTYLALIEAMVSANYDAISQVGEALTVSYISKVLAALLPSGEHETSVKIPEISVVEKVLMALLQEKMDDEIRRGVCLVGPHRDDIQFSLSGVLADAYASQGQQRSIVLALKLSELQLLTQKLEEPPLLLLDDVMAELDADRQRLLVEYLHPDSQVIMTTTHSSASWQPFLFEGSENPSKESVAVFEVLGGTIQKKPLQVCYS